VGVEIQNANPTREALVAQHGDGHGDVVHRAQARAAIRVGVVETAEQVGHRPALANGQPCRGQRPAAGQPHGGHQAVDRDVPGLDAEHVPKDLRRTERLEPGRGMHPGEGVVPDARRRAHLTGDEALAAFEEPQGEVGAAGLEAQTRRGRRQGQAVGRIVENRQRAVGGEPV
jgi:hypothetical protein